MNRWFHTSEVILLCIGLSLLMFMAGMGTARITDRMTKEPPAQEIRQSDGSVILERNPEKLPPELPQIPRGATVTRVTSVSILPPDHPGQIEPRKPIQLDLIQIQTSKGSRIIARSPDGEIIGGSDWTEPARAARVYRWQAQAVRAWTWEGAAWGASIGYTRGPFVGTVAAFPGQVQAGIGFRW